MSNEQRTPEWYAKRAGKFTGSRFVDVMARSKKKGEENKPLKAYYDLIMEVVTERISGNALEGAFGYALQWGIDVEPYAREAYELKTGHFVTPVDFVVHPKYSFVGCSPDGLIGENGGLEMKCPKDSMVHLGRFIDGMPEDIKPQVQGSMWVTGRDWWDFVSYDPRMPPSHRLLRITIERDQKYIDQLEANVLEAEARAQTLYEQLMLKAA